MQELNLSLTLAIGIEKIMTFCTKLVSIFLHTFKCVSVAMKLKNEKKKMKAVGLDSRLARGSWLTRARVWLGKRYNSGRYDIFLQLL